MPSASAYKVKVTPTKQSPPVPLTSISHVTSSNREQRIFSRLVLLLAVLAVVLTSLASISIDVIVQELSQTELGLAKTNGQGNNSNHGKTIRTVINHEPYGYVTVKDDSSKKGFLRYLSHASFYEYKLPRAVLKVSQHREELTLEESEELQFRAGVRKRPKGWDPSATVGRNIFLDEPYRDQTINRLFKRSRKQIVTSLGMGILSFFGLFLMSGRLHGSKNSSNRKSLCTPCFDKVGFSISKALSSPLWNGLWHRNTLVTVVVVSILVGLTALAGVLSASAIAILIRNDRFCGKRCASSSLDASIVLEVDACIEQCFLGRGGRFAIVASFLWFLVSLMLLAVTAISILAEKPKVAASLSGKRWWRLICLPLAIRPKQLFQIPELPLVSQGHRQL